MSTTRIEPLHPQDLTPECLRGCQLQHIDVSAAPHAWNFAFDRNVRLTVECPWRLVTAHVLVAASVDQDAWATAARQIDAVASTLAAIDHAQVLDATLHTNTSDLAIRFANGCELHVLVLSTFADEWVLWKPDGTQLVAADGQPVQLHRFQTSSPT